ncbi:MAG TPA: tetratricopeptide repeat protein, partial [Vampirovibrionales bacterium]
MFQFFYMYRSFLLIFLLLCSSSIPSTAKWSTIPTLSNAGLERNADQAFKKKNYDQAIEYYSQVIATNPTNINEILLKRAEAYKAIGKYEEAILDFSNLLKTVPNNFDVLQRRGMLYLNKLNNSVKALEDFDAAHNKALNQTTIQKDYLAELKAQRGMAKLYLGMFDDGIQDCRNAEEILPLNPNVLSCIVTYNSYIKNYDDALT